MISLSVFFGLSELLRLGGSVDQLSHVPGAWCITKPEDVAGLPRASRVGVVVQSTWNGPGFTDIVKRLSEKYYEVRAVNTICTDTKNRQSEVEGLAQEVEVMVVVGGKTSANTKHLAELAAMNGARAYHIEGPDELEAAWFAGVGTAGLMSGASTPGWLVDRGDRSKTAAARIRRGANRVAVPRTRRAHRLHRGQPRQVVQAAGSGRLRGGGAGPRLSPTRPALRARTRLGLRYRQW